jgi:hypothetical protein
MLINKSQSKIIVDALYEAIESIEALIDVHRIAWDKRITSGVPEKCIPKEYRSDVNKWNQRIKQYKRVIEYIKNGS